MHTSIVERKKGTYVYLLILSVFTLAVGVVNRNASLLFRYFSIPMMIACACLVINCIIILLNPHGAIELVGDTVVVRRGIRKTTIRVSDMIEVFPTPYPNNPNSVQKNVVSIKLCTDGKEKILVCGDVKDVELAITKIAAFLK